MLVSMVDLRRFEMLEGGYGALSLRLFGNV